MKLIALLAMTVALYGAKPEEPKVGTGRGASDRMEILATVHANKEAVKQVLGDEMNGYIFVVEVTIKPRMEEGVKIDRDDFQLLTTDDGQRTKPFAPAQLTGTGGLIIKSQRGPSSGIMGQNNGPVWSGPVGGGPMQLPGNGGGIGNGTTQIETPNAEVNDKKEKENPMKKVLEEKELPAGEIKTPTKGLLYFPIDGKHKPKNIVLLYRGLGGRIEVDFK
ncbi:MAG: hypothetical protein FJW36_24135 [Acidobacteria bacterium]|nr:hypothetical protein [Acidobacteriota bacterium]